MENKEPLTIGFAELIILEQEFLEQYGQFRIVTNAFMDRVYKYLQERSE